MANEKKNGLKFCCCKKLYLPNGLDLAIRAQSIILMVFHIVTFTVKLIRITDFRVWLRC